MSGPTVASFGLDAGLLIAFEAMQAAAAIAEGHAAEERRQEGLAAEREAERQQRIRAGESGRQAAAAEQAAGEARAAELSALRTELAAAGGEAATVDLAAMAAAAPDLDRQLAAFVAEARREAALPESVVAARRAKVGGILARALPTPERTLPADVRALAVELMTTTSDERAEALASELRLRVAHHNEAATAAAAARVLEQSLRDLGYEVEDIADTLFVEGGIVHFQRAGWQGHFIRLRVDAGRGAMNFNVVRAGSPGEDRAREDMLAEERWCAEFPRLRETLAARGIGVEVTRMLAAGEVPVQVVAADSLPAFAADEERHAAPPRAMQR